MAPTIMKTSATSGRLEVGMSSGSISCFSTDGSPIPGIEYPAT